MTIREAASIADLQLATVCVQLFWGSGKAPRPEAPVADRQLARQKLELASALTAQMWRYKSAAYLVSFIPACSFNWDIILTWGTMDGILSSCEL